MLRDHARFTSTRGSMLSILGQGDPAGSKMMAVSDPPIHTGFRAPLAKVLSRESLKYLRPQLREFSRASLDPLVDGSVQDFAQLVSGFPIAFTGILMGLPPADWANLAMLTTTAVAAEDPVYVSGNGTGTLASAHHELFEYLSDKVSLRRRQPGSDLISYITQEMFNGRRQRQDEAVYNVYSLLLGATVTTPHAISSTVKALAADRPQDECLRANCASLLGTTIEEGFRWSSPTNHFMRYATGDCELSGVKIRSGDPVVVWLGSANRDEFAFEDPDKFKIARTPNRHLALGAGVHYCIGAPLARMALDSFLTEFIEIGMFLKHAGPIEYLASNFVAGIKKMPMQRY